MINLLIIATIVIAVILLIILLYKPLYLLYYTISCFRNIVAEPVLQDHYKISIDGNRVNNIRLSWSGTMYLYMIIDKSVDKSEHMSKIQQHLALLEESMAVQSLYGLVISDYELYESDEGHYIYLFKFIPRLQGNFGLRLLTVLLLIILATIIILYL